MDYSRYGRLNKKKIEELLNEMTKDYDMSKIFPYLPTRSKNKDTRYTMNSFKTMSKKYRYCYSLYNSCVAEIKKNNVFQSFIEVDNKVYVFTNIEDIDTIDCELIYDIYALVPKVIQLSVLEDMKQRKLDYKKYNKLKNFVTTNNFIKLPEVLPQLYLENVSNELYLEFKWRCLLHGTGIYKLDQGTEYEELKTKRTKIETHYSLLKSWNRYGMKEEFEQYINELMPLVEEMQNIVPFDCPNEEYYNKLLNSQPPEYILLKYEKIISKARLYHNDFMNEFEKFKHLYFKYNFLEESYHSNRLYKDYFDKHTKYLSKWKTQQIFKKYKQEHLYINNTLTGFFILGQPLYQVSLWLKK